ncbi:MAG: HPr family phosphocarrier protein [Sneathiellaceae bacterium]
MSEPSAPLRRTLTILNERGLHARAAAKFAQCAGRFEAAITVSRGPHSVDGTSIMGLMMLGAARGLEVVVEVAGPDAEAAMQALTDLVDGHFGES